MGSEALDLKTDKQLLDALQQASKAKQTVGEILEQRVSFVLGSMDPDREVTRAEIRRALVAQEGAEDARG
jgi:hypothetical protein